MRSLYPLTRRSPEPLLERFGERRCIRVSQVRSHQFHRGSRAKLRHRKRKARQFNTPRPIHPVDLRGRVVLIHAFQMLCPGCVSHGLPQALRIRETFPEEDVAVIGLHTVFEHHDAMRPPALAAFIHEYRLRFPIGVDEPSVGSDIPKTMAQLRLQGTPSVVLLDREGRLRLNHFGILDDLRLGAMVGQLLNESPTKPLPAPIVGAAESGCSEKGCPIEVD